MAALAISFLFLLAAAGVNGELYNAMVQAVLLLWLLSLLDSGSQEGPAHG